MSLDFSSPTLKFSVSGLRGLYPQDIHPQNILDIVYSFALSLPSGDIALARDTRPSGEAIYHLVCSILLACSRNVHLLGIVPTPTIKNYVKSKNLAGGIMISASHNPMQYNAFKFIKANGFFFEEIDNQKWQDNLFQNTKSWSTQTGKLYMHKQTEANAMHIEQVVDSVFGKSLPNFSSLKVAIDPVSACASKIIPELLEKLGVSFVSVHGTFAKEFPRQAEPVASALTALSNLVVEHQCDIGFAFDPDADRLALVDETGVPLGEEYTLPLVLSSVLKERSGSCVVNLSSSWLSRYVCEQHNASLFLSKVGEANVVSQMVKKQAVFGGEGNGGIIDPQIDSMGRDSLAGVAWILRLLLEEQKTLSQLAKQLPNVFMVKKALPLQNLEHWQKNLTKHFATMNIDDRDGLHFCAKETGLPWFHIRPSNTEPIVRLIVEGENQVQVENLIKQIENLQN